MNLDRARVIAAIVILGLAALAIVAIVLIDTLRSVALPGYVTTVAGFLIGFATHELGVQRGVSVAAAAAPIAVVNPNNMMGS